MDDVTEKISEGFRSEQLGNVCLRMRRMGHGSGVERAALAFEPPYMHEETETGVLL